MSSDSGALRAPRLAEMAADRLRSRILRGDLEDGDLLPPQDRLLVEFGVSRPTIREALRILETEGLVSIRRGATGGAVVHCPRAENTAYSLGLVLESRAVTVHDVGLALKRLEADCAALCAERPDRAETVVPSLRRCNETARLQIDEPLAYTHTMAEFHEQMIEQCGNATLAVLAGAVESLHLAHVKAWAEQVTGSGQFPDREYRLAGLGVHEDLTDLIAAGDGAAASALALDHFDPYQFYVSDEDPERPVTAAPLRHLPSSPS